MRRIAFERQFRIVLDRAGVDISQFGATNRRWCGCGRDACLVERDVASPTSAVSLSVERVLDAMPALIVT